MLKYIHQSIEACTRYKSYSDREFYASEVENVQLGVLYYG